jgi:hypothetical protein
MGIQLGAPRNDILACRAWDRESARKAVTLTGETSVVFISPNGYANP